MKKQSACPPACPPMRRERRGSGLIFAVVLLFVILGMVITLASVTMLETKMNQKTKSSVGAFYGSESGVEWALNQIATKPGTNQLSTIPGFTTNVASCPPGVGTCKVYFLDSSGKVLASTATIDQVKAVRSVGTQGDDTQRAIEAAVADAGESGSYIAYGTTSCSSGWTPVYTGKATTSAVAQSPSAGNAALGGVFCKQGNPFTTDASSSLWMTGSTKSDSNLDCAVCAKGGSYVAYGTTSCNVAAGWTAAYTGVVTTSGATGAVGGVFCKQGGSFADSGLTHYWVTGHSNSNSNLDCALCVK